MAKVILFFISLVLTTCVFAQPTSYDGPETNTVFFRLFDGENEIQLDKIDTSKYSIEVFCDSVQRELEFYNSWDTRYPALGMMNGLAPAIFELVIIKKGTNQNDTMNLVFKDLLPLFSVGIFIHFQEGSFLFEKDYFLEKIRQNQEFPVHGNSVVDITPGGWVTCKTTD
ncbi:MAG: hypothetical protein C0592_10790 [Marinilabiliales bacterium]|nr:MAG: hypothetical protein C0592_10790 [Marinilabiliales bacterium]